MIHQIIPLHLRNSLSFSLLSSTRANIKATKKGQKLVAEKASLMQETQPREFARKIKTEGGTRRKPSSIRYIPLGSKSGPRNEFVRPSSMAWFHCERRHAKWRYDLPREGRARSSKISRRSFSWTWISPTWDIHQRVFVHDPPLDPWINIYTLLRSFSRWILWSFVVSICRPKVHTRLITFTWYFYAFFYVNPRMMKTDDISRLHIIILSNHIRTFSS